jgi:putative CocE/NonD family hydrolase
MTHRTLSLMPLLALALLPLGADRADEPAPAARSEIPASFTPREQRFDYSRRVVDIPMRDGVKLHTVILIPRGAHRAPILLSRTPYDADERAGGSEPHAHLDAELDSIDVASEAVTRGGYIRVQQDVRGKHGSEGDYLMTRPLSGPLNPTGIDHSTDTYDTIDWLVKNLPESNGKVGILGISYDGFTSLMALVHPHPALRAAVPINAMVDGWVGDDWFHNGAFRLDTFTYVHDQEATRGSDVKWWSDDFDDYASWLAAGSAGHMAALHGLEQTGFAGKIMAHPSYDEFWQGQALDRILAAQGISVPTMLVHSLWDQEDIYGNIALWNALQAKQAGDPRLFLVIGPWFHHQQRLDGSRIGAIEFGSDTALHFRLEVLRPFLDHYLKDEAPPLDLPRVTAFETGTNRWLALPGWPRGCAQNCAIEATPLYLAKGGALAFERPAHADSDAYVSDPAKPVPYLPRPIHIAGTGSESWETWLVSDQREAAARTDVLVFETEPLEAPVKVSGQPVAHLIASTTGTDGDFVVKLIDEYPPEVGREPRLGGYQLMISADILRGRYRRSFTRPEPIPAGTPQEFRWVLPTANHVFLPGHRIMVQVQSSWFPLYDRNPQTYVPNIFQAQPKDYRSATIKVLEGGERASYVELPLVKAGAGGPRRCPGRSGVRLSHGLRMLGIGDARRMARRRVAVDPRLIGRVAVTRRRRRAGARCAVGGRGHQMRGGAVRRYHARSVEHRRARGCRDRRMSAVRLGRQGGILHRLGEVLALHRGGRDVLLVHGGSLRGRRLRSDAARTVVAHAVDRGVVDRGVVDHRVVDVGVVDHGGVHAHHGRVVGEYPAPPLAADEADAAVAEAVVHAAVEADVRAPVAGMKQVHAADEAPVSRGPQHAHSRGRDPGAGHPVVPAVPGPVTGRPQPALLGTGRLLILGQRRWRLARLHLGIDGGLRVAGGRRRRRWGRRGWRRIHARRGRRRHDASCERCKRAQRDDGEGSDDRQSHVGAPGC